MYTENTAESGNQRPPCLCRWGRGAPRFPLYLCCILHSPPENPDRYTFRQRAQRGFGSTLKQENQFWTPKVNLSSIEERKWDEGRETKLGGNCIIQIEGSSYLESFKVNWILFVCGKTGNGRETHVPPARGLFRGPNLRRGLLINAPNLHWESAHRMQSASWMVFFTFIFHPWNLFLISCSFQV